MNTLLLMADHSMADFVRSGLKSEGHYCEPAQNERDALNKAQTREFDALLLQDPHPKLCALSLCQTLRRKGLDMFVLCIGDGMDMLRSSELIRAGADDYLKRPLSFTELVARMDALMRRSRKYTPPRKRVVAGDLVIDVDRYEVRHAGRLIALTMKEFSLLQLLASAPDRLFSRARILEQVWGFDADPLTNVVDVHVSNLRRKLGGSEAASLIQTVRGVGYKLRGTLLDAKY
jgi:two-component system, OmpR family, response regulator